MGKKVGVSIENPEIWTKFIDFVVKRYGKKHTVLGQELEKALIFYMKGALINNLNTLTQTQKKENRIVNYWKKRGFYEAISIGENALRYSIREIAGGDHRTEDRYYNSLKEKGLIPKGVVKNPPKKPKRKSKNIYYF